MWRGDAIGVRVDYRAFAQNRNQPYKRPGFSLAGTGAVVIETAYDSQPRPLVKIAIAFGVVELIGDRIAP